MKIKLNYFYRIIIAICVMTVFQNCQSDDLYQNETSTLETSTFEAKDLESNEVVLDQLSEYGVDLKSRNLTDQKINEILNSKEFLEIWNTRPTLEEFKLCKDKKLLASLKKSKLENNKSLNNGYYRVFANRVEGGIFLGEVELDIDFNLGNLTYAEYHAHRNRLQNVRNLNSDPNLADEDFLGFLQAVTQYFNIYNARLALPVVRMNDGLPMAVYANYQIVRNQAIRHLFQAAGQEFLFNRVGDIFEDIHDDPDYLIYMAIADLNQIRNEVDNINGLFDGLQNYFRTNRHPNLDDGLILHRLNTLAIAYGGMGRRLNELIAVLMLVQQDYSDIYNLGCPNNNGDDDSDGPAVCNVAGSGRYISVISHFNN